LPSLAALFDATPLTRDPVHDWMAAHPEELARHRGQHVAIDPAKGIVATGADFVAVSEALDALGIPPESDDVLVVIA
jgi:hypothetical protein